MIDDLKEIRTTALNAFQKMELRYEDINEGILIDAYNFECILEKSYNVSFKYSYYRDLSSKKHVIRVKLDEGYTCYTYDKGSVHLATLEEVLAFTNFFFNYCKTIVEVTEKLHYISSTYEMPAMDMRIHRIDTLLNSDL